MKLTSLRRYIKTKDLGVDINLSNQKLVIDGDYFNDAYKKSFSQFLLGGEYDRYASYLRSTLSCFIESNITCYVVFKGAMDAPNEKRLMIHQKIIDKTDAVMPGKDNEYCEPIFVKDVIKEVLNELGIRYYVCKYDVKECLFRFAKQFNCPILTPYFEYSIFRVSCVTPNSVIFKKTKKMVTCTIYKWESVKRLFPSSYDLLAIYISIVSEDNSYYEKLPGLLGCQQFRLITTAIGWLRKITDRDYAIKSIADKLDDEEKSTFTKNISEIRSLFYSNRGKEAIEYFVPTKPPKQTFQYNIATGKIPVPYINLMFKQTFSGSWLIVDNNQPDAMLCALEIVFYAYAHLTGYRNLNIKFIGRQHITSQVWDIQKYIQPSMGKKSTNVNYFQLFLSDNMPEFDINSLNNLPEDSWLIIITLLYYSITNDMSFTHLTHAVLLSYVILSVVSNKIGLIKRNNDSLFNPSPNNHKDEKGISYTDCLIVGNNVLDLFYINEEKLKKNYSREILYRMAEFQHCLQHMNYLSNMYGEIKGTCYHKSLNMTFVYNIVSSTILNAPDSPVLYLEKLIDCAPIFSIYKNMLAVFYECEKKHNKY